MWIYFRNIDSEEIHKFAYISDIKSAKDAKETLLMGEYTVTYYKNGDVTDPNSGSNS